MYCYSKGIWLISHISLWIRVNDLQRFANQTNMELPIITECYIFSWKRWPFWILTTISEYRPHHIIERKWLHKQCLLLYRGNDSEFEFTCLEFPIITEYHVISCKRQPFWILTTILKYHIHLFNHFCPPLLRVDYLLRFAIPDNLEFIT